MPSKPAIAITACLIVKNEETEIFHCLQSVADCDEIVILDTGSIDGTATKVSQWAATRRPRGTKLKYLPDVYAWNDDFAEARNTAADHATGDWLLVIDADERLTVGSLAAIRESLAADSSGSTRRCRVVSRDGTCIHAAPRLYKRDSPTRWRYPIHNVLTPENGGTIEGMEIIYGYSAAHQRDPDRALRILTRHRDAVPRNLYYLAREYWYRKDYEQAIPIFEEYTRKSVHLSEQADAHLYLARMHWTRSEGDLARKNCLMAIALNPDFSEALSFMATISQPAHSARWQSFAELATNTGVYMVRGS